MKRFIITFAIALCGVIASAQDSYIGSWYKIEIPSDELIGRSSRDVYNFRTSSEEIVVITDPGNIGNVNEVKLFNQFALHGDRWVCSRAIVGYYNDSGTLVDKEEVICHIDETLKCWLRIEYTKKFLNYMFLNTGYIRVIARRAYSYCDITFTTFKSGPIYSYIE